MQEQRTRVKSITKEDVEQFFKENVEIKKKPRRYNSFVAPNNNYSYQIDMSSSLKKI